MTAQAIDWKSRLAPAVNSIAPSGIRKFFDIAASMEDVISLGVGEPDFVTPWSIRESCVYGLERGYTSYTANRGMPELRMEIEKKQLELKKINDAVSDKTDKLAEINAKIASASGVILTLSPGRYTVGRDIAPGRYSITGYGSFAVADQSGQSKYNTTLNNTAYEIELSSGDKIKLDSTVKLTPVS